MRRRPLLPAVFLALALLVPLAACGSKDKEAAPSDDTAATEPSTTAPDPHLTVVATATVPEVEVVTTRPPDAVAVDGTVTGEGASQSMARAGGASDIPRAGLNSAGVRKTDAGFAFENPTYFDNPLVFRVTEDDGEWLKVQVLARPNGQEGWIKRSDVALSEIRTRMELNLSTFHLQAFDGDRLIAETNVVIGKDSTYTPLGTFFLTERISRPEAGAYGPWILATSAYSETLDTFDGGLPQVAFHGTNKPDLIGTKASNGCVRMPNEVDRLLADQLPPGTPITITA